MDKKSPIKQDLNTHLTFSINKEKFSINTRYVLTILEYREPTQIPRTPEFIKGIIDFRGEVVPILDLRIKFEYQNNVKIEKDTCIIIIELEDKSEIYRFGTIVDRVNEVLEINTEEIRTPPEMLTNINHRILKGVVDLEGQLTLILDIEQLFKEDLVTFAEAKKEFTQP